MSLTNLMLKATGAGAEWVLWLLVILSVVSIALIIERWIYFATHRVNIDVLQGKLAEALRAGNIEQAKQAVSGSRAIECVVVSSGLNNISRGLHAVAETMHSTKARERLRLEAFLPVLGTLGNNAPFVGLLGTVIGIIKASADLAQAQAEKQAGATAVMGGVFEALVATAVGLFVALPAVVAFNYFQRQARTKLIQVDVLAHLLISFMKGSKSAEAAAARPPKIPRVPDGR